MISGNHWHYLISRKPCQIRNGDKPKSSRSQLVNYTRQRLNRSRAIATCVMQQDHFAARFRIFIARAIECSTHYLIGRNSRHPIIRIDSKANHDVPKVLRNDRGFDFLRLVRFCVAEIRRTKQNR